MGFTEDYLALKEKRKKKEEQKTTGHSFTDEYLALKKKRTEGQTEDIAPVFVNKTAALYGVDREIAPTKTEKDERKWFEKGAFEDGWQFGDLAKTILGTGTDIKENLFSGIIGMGEKVVDAGAYLVGGAAGLLGADEFKDKTADFIKKDLYDEEKVAKKLIGVSASGVFNDTVGIDTEEDSWLGEKADALVQSGGQLLATAGLQVAGVPWFVTSGVTSFGSEAENALNEGASYGGAGLSAAISAGAEILTEKISGGISFGGKALDDVLTQRIARGVSNKVVRTLSKLGLDMAGEGTEEVLSGVMSAIGQKITYADDKELTELFSVEDALESFIGGAVLGGGSSGVNALATKKGVDYVSGLTSNEKQVVDKIFADRVAEEEKGGKVTEKQKDAIYDEVLRDMERGYIDTDTIEEVLGGESYNTYKQTVDSEDAILKEYEELGNKQNATLAEQTRYNELHQQVGEIKANSQRDLLKSTLSENVFKTVKNDRLAESYNERARRGQAFEADLSKYDTKQQETIKKAVESGILNNTNRTHEFVDMIAKITADKGVLFDFTNNERLKESGFAVNGKAVNGYVTKDGVTLNIDSHKSLNSVVGHEITHVLEGTEFYDTLKQVVTEYAKTKGDYQGRYDTLAKLYEGVKDADVDAELTADLVGDYLFTDEDFVRNLSVQHRNVFQKIYDEVKYLCKVATAGSKEARELEKVKRAFEKAYQEGGKSVDGVKHSLSDSDGKQLTKEQQEYFKDSKMRDENGNLKVMYHGSQDAGFHVFDAKMSDDDTSFFFVDSNDVAASYSGTTETYEAKSFNTADDANKFFAEIGRTEYRVVEKDGEYTLYDDGGEVATSKNLAEIYEEFCEYEGVGYGSANYKVYLNLKNPLVVDAKGRNWNNVSREYSQEIADRYNSLTAEEKEALSDIAGWEEYSVFRDEILSMAKAKANGEYYDATLASAYEKLGGANANLFDAFSIASDSFSEDSIKEFAVKQANTRDYAKIAKEQGYDGVIFNNIVDVGGYGTGSEGAATVAIAFDSNQIKSVANEKPTADKDIRYSLSDSQQADNEVKIMDDGTVTKFSLSTWTPETQAKVRENLVKAGYEADRVDKWIKDTNSVASVIAADKGRLDFEAADNQVMLKDNQEYIKTLDASTLCAKRLVYQGTFDAIQHRMPNTMLSSDDLIDLLNMMKEHGEQTPCGVCYVESRRRHLGKFAQDWLNSYNGEYKPNLDEVTTSDGLEALRKSHPQAYKDFVDAMNKKGSSNPKVVQLRTKYRNEIMSLTPAQIRKIEAIGGLRVQSFSDFETPHLLDMMQAVMDMSAKGLHSQAYTKVPNFAWVFGDTGIKINLSLIAEGDGFDADGNLAFSSTEGMSLDDAMKLRDAYSQNVGTIIVGANDKHILACMADDRIDFIIPFHRSGWGMKELEMMGMSSYTDYTYGQKEHDLASGKGVENLYPPDYWDYNLSGKENAERYLNLCAKTGREPKFSQFLVNNGDGSYSLQPDGSTDGYWKMLIDFKMYDNEGNGAAQQKVQPNFNMEEAHRILNEYEGGANTLPVAKDVVEEFVAKYQAQHSLSEVGEQSAPVKGWEVWGKDLRVQPNATPIADSNVPASEVAVAENATTTPEEIAPVKPAKQEAFEAIRPKPQKEPRMVRADSENTTPKAKQRKWVGTSTGSEAVDGQILPEDLDQELIHYQPIPNKKTLGNANAKLDRMGYEASVTYLNSQFASNKVTLDDIALGERLIQEAVKRGDTKTAGDLIMDISILGTELGQKVQALSIIKRLTPEGQLKMLQRTVERGKTKGDKAFADVEITQEMIDHILKTYGKDGTYDQAELNKAVEDVKQKIADQMSVGALDYINEWRYLSMLGNPKTHIRNIVSNVAMWGTRQVKNAVARTIEDIAPIKNRTKTWKAASEDVKNFAKQAAIEMSEGDTDNKYSEAGSIKAKRQILPGVIGKASKINSTALSAEDTLFSKPAFRSALSEYLTANGIKTKADIKKNGKLVAKAKQYAMEQAKEATFQQDSYIASKISEIERKNILFNVSIGAVLPFKKTPINIAKTAAAYSPLGFARNIYDAVQVGKGEMDASEAVDHLAQTITGTSLTLIGYMLAQAGILNGAGDDDKEGEYDYQLGKQSYSFNFNGDTYSLSWLSPVAMPLFVGTNAYEQLVEGKEWNADVVFETLAQTLDPLSEMSFLSSLDSVLSSYDSGVEKFMGIFESAGQSYVTQFVPTLSSQVAQVMDDTKRSTKAAADSGFKFGEQTINKIAYKIPGLRNTLEPTTDIWGNEVKQSENILTRAFEAFIAPYSRREDIATAVDEEIKDLYSQTGDTGVIPTIPNNYVSYDGEKYEMSAEDYTEFKKMYGQTAVDLMERLFRTNTYQMADSETRADMVNRVYDYARDTARKEYFSKLDVDFTNATEDGNEVYKEDPIKGAIEADLPVDEYVFSEEYPEKYSFFKQNGITYKQYSTADEDGKRAYSWAYENPGKYTMSKAISDDFLTYYQYKSDCNDFDAKDASGESVSGLKKERVIEYINGLDIDYGSKIILFRSMYDGKEDCAAYNADIVDYLNSREDISYDETVTILKELGFTVDSQGNIYW